MILKTVSASDVQPWWIMIGPVLTLLLGYFGTILTEGRRDTRQAKKEAAAEKATLATQEAIRLRDFELTTLQGTLDGLRALREAWVAAMDELKPGGSYDATRIRVRGPSLKVRVETARRLALERAHLIVLEGARQSAITACGTQTDLDSAFTPPVGTISIPGLSSETMPKEQRAALDAALISIADALREVQTRKVVTTS